MNNPLPPCPECTYEYTYEDRNFIVCSQCGHEWQELDLEEEESTDDLLAKDVHGNILQDGDHVIIVRDLKVRGSSTPLKQGTKVKGIRIVESLDDHNIDCKIPGFGPMKLKSEVVKKSN